MRYLMTAFYICVLMAIVAFTCKYRKFLNDVFASAFPSLNSNGHTELVEVEDVDRHSDVWE